MNKWRKERIQDTSVPLPDGGDTHIDIFANAENGFVVTTSIPIPGLGDLKIHDKPFDVDSDFDIDPKP